MMTWCRVYSLRSAVRKSSGVHPRITDQLSKQPGPPHLSVPTPLERPAVPVPVFGAGDSAGDWRPTGRTVLPEGVRRGARRRIAPPASRRFRQRSTDRGWRPACSAVRVALGCGFRPRVRRCRSRCGRTSMAAVDRPGFPCRAGGRFGTVRSPAPSGAFPHSEPASSAGSAGRSHPCFQQGERWGGSRPGRPGSRRSWGVWSAG